MKLQIDKNERWLLSASFIMNMGVDAGYFIGLVGYVAYAFRASSAIIAATTAVLSVCYMLGNLLGGIIVDRIGPRRAAFFSSLAMALVCVVAQFAGASLVAFMMLGGFYGLVGAVLQSSYHAYAPYLSRRRDGMRRINSYITTGNFISSIIGGAIGALIMSRYEPLRLFLFVGVAVIISSFLVLKTRELYSPHHSEESTEPDASGDKEGMSTEKQRPLHNALEGWRLIKSAASLRFYLLIAIAMWFCFGAFDALEALYYRDILLMPISWMGWVNAIIGAGLAIGAFALSKIPGKYIKAVLLIGFLVAEGAFTVLYVATRFPFWSAVGAFTLGIAYGICEPLLRTLIQADSPLKAAGRVMGTVDMIRKGFTLIPLAIAPTLHHLFGIQPVLVGAGMFTIILAAVLYPFSRRLDAETAAAGSRHIDHVNPFSGED